MCIGYGEYVLDKDPYNFNTTEEYIAFYAPELLEEIGKGQNEIQSNDVRK